MIQAKKVMFFVAAASLILVSTAAQAAVSTRAIDRVRSKAMLEEVDFKAIDTFVAKAVASLVMTSEFSSISKRRALILSRSVSSGGGRQSQYAEQYADSVYKYISQALAETTGDEDSEHKFETTLNLLILIEGLGQLRLAETALGFTDDENEVIRYWAVRVVTSESVVEKLNSVEEDNSRLAEKIIGRLSGLVNNADHEIISIVVKFAGKINSENGSDLLLSIADMRIKKYAAWQVENELLDIVVLQELCTKLAADGQNGSAIGQRFGQLYSFVIQKYVQGRSFLTEDQKQRLVSVMVETEKTCLGMRLGMIQITIRQAVESDDMTAILLVHSKLFGDETRAGKLANRFNFDYGKGRTAPLKLPAKQ